MERFISHNTPHPKHAATKLQFPSPYWGSQQCESSHYHVKHHANVLPQVQ